MTQSTDNRWIKRLMVAAGAAVCLAVTTAGKPANAQISIQVPFVSLGIGVPAYYPYYYSYYPYYGYYPYRRAYWGYHHRRCHWWHHRCHYY
jgi:hypothetical protein